MNAKRPKDSEIVISSLMLPNRLNAAGKVHGGEIMKMMDEAAGISAMKHAGSNAVTARVDELMFKYPIHVGELVICHAKVIYVGRTSMEVLVRADVDNFLKGEPVKTALTALFTLVALDDNGRPREVPKLVLESDEEYRLFEEGKSRHIKYKKSKV